MTNPSLRLSPRCAGRERERRIVTQPDRHRIFILLQFTSTSFADGWSSAGIVGGDFEAGFLGGLEEELAMLFVHGVGLGARPGLGAHVKAVGIGKARDAEDGFDLG